jgi:phosphatidylglycerol:prolipoprotein diacylglycerol transferase
VWPVILQIGPLTIYSFGAMVAIGCMVGAWLTAREMDRHGLDPEVAWSLTVWATFVGFVSAAIWYYVQHHFWELLAGPFDTIAASLRATWDDVSRGEGGVAQRMFATLRTLGSGFVWYGGLIGGVATASWIIYRHRLPWLTVVDCAAPGLALALGIGRIGCQLAGDGDWGYVTDVPWGMAYPRAIVGWPPLDEHGVPYPADVRVHPAPLYEMLACFAIFAVLWTTRKRPHVPGALFWWYLVLSGSSRFLIEFWRLNPRIVAGLTAAQLFSLLVIAIGAWRLLMARGTIVTRPARQDQMPQPARQ